MLRRLNSPAGKGDPAREDRRVVDGQGQFRRRRAHMRQLNRQIVAIDHGVLRGLARQPIRVLRDVLVRRRHRQEHNRVRHFSATPRTADLLPKACARPRKAALDDHFQRADVDAQLQRVGRNHAQQPPVRQLFFDLAPLFRGVAAPITGQQVALIVPRDVVQPIARLLEHNLRFLA